MSDKRRTPTPPRRRTRFTAIRRAPGDPSAEEVTRRELLDRMSSEVGKLRASMAAWDALGPIHPRLRSTIGEEWSAMTHMISSLGVTFRPIRIDELPPAGCYDRA
jgi:hypothetical protein